MMGSFHMTNVLLTCLGKYIYRSGLENIFIENSVSGTCLSQDIYIQGSNYVRSTRAFLMMSDVIQRLKMKAYLAYEMV